MTRGLFRKDRKRQQPKRRGQHVPEVEREDDAPAAALSGPSAPPGPSDSSGAGEREHRASRESGDAGQDVRLLADAARSCAALRAAERLAGWIGDGRTVRTAPVLSPVQFLTAARALGEDGAAPGLVPAWSRAQHAGMIETAGKRTLPGPALEAWRSGEPSIVLQLWREAYDSYTGLDGAGSDGTYVRPEAFGAQAALRLLAARGRPIQARKLQARTTRLLREAQRGLVPGLLEPERDAVAGLALLVEFGAAGSDEHTVWLTPLGQWLVRSRRERAGWARALVAYLRNRPSEASDALAEQWMRTRNPARAVRDLFTVAAEGGSVERSIAVDLARKVGPAAAPEWRRWTDHPWIGPHARIWVATIAEGSAPDVRDVDWAILDGLAGLLRRADGPKLRETIRWQCHELLGLDAGVRMAAVDHPDRDLVVEVLAEHHAFQRYYRLRVELADTDPVVWRTLLVPVGSTLADLHRALCTAIGWDGGHEYVFEIAGRTYASFDHQDAGVGGLRLRDLVGNGDGFCYEYDELERWRHLVTVEADDQEPPNGQWALVLDGGGACPPPECGGPDGYRRLCAALREGPDHPEFERARQVMAVERPEEFDPAGFEPSLANAVLAADTAPLAHAA